MNPIHVGITLRPAVGRLKQVIHGFILAISLLAIGAGDLCAAMAVLNNGREIDISVEHLQRIKDSPGIFFFTYPPEKIFKHKIKDWVVIKLSDELGSGFLAGTPENMTQALAIGNANEGISKPSPSQATTLQQAHRNESPPWVEFEASYGYRQDQIDWNIAGNLQGGNPNILSELTWEDLLIHEMRLDIHTTLNRPIFFRGSLHNGIIVDGENQDSDYAADDRELEFSRSNNNADEGSTFDALLGIGYNFRFFSERLNIIPQAGYSIHRQNLTITDGHQTITWVGGPPLGSFDGLDSTYESQWWGPWIGMNLAVNITKSMEYPPPFSISLYYEYHWAEYYAQADWNLRKDFDHPKSFEHEADGTGWLMGAAFRVRISDGWSLTAGYESETWSAEDGIDRVFLANGNTISTRLNEVNWESETYQLGFTFCF